MCRTLSFDLPPLHLPPQALFATGAQAPPGHWERIAACLDPTEAQRAALRHMWRSFAVQLQAIRWAGLGCGEGLVNSERPCG